MENAEREENNQKLRDSLKELEIRTHDLNKALEKVNKSIELRGCNSNQGFCV